ncbi:MAG: bifunctional 4-hydroxy-2-oxoglutarate aldolase/2-dehydro-3-deoxy-phosphogluconate aldolase [Desulfurivibrionaceae bacterium]|nr:bifunctional 4-hydroxy-2-oxoglutarate aldolase/2-dehydro-3-deoxy-phosphogluconate aldolase [Desulfobulbales bacterium]MDT8335581.1 bifunctional 4-hydroxy-2-oxoglutarate aldolase/2-dehydro-3-deoxy-phosphogluconate aldolase [Desulfurivibrionaceae bacterium]
MEQIKLDVPLIGILRGIDGGFFREVMATSFAAGLTALEITMNTENAAEIVRSCRARVPAGKLLGIGTVRNRDEAEIAIAAGAMFLVTPNTDIRVIEYGAKRNIPVIAGAFTPTEIYRAWAAGATMIKVFPCSVAGPAYLREIRGPFDHIPLLAVGGVTRENLGEYFRAGAAGVGVGSALFGAHALREKKPKEIGENVGRFVEAVTTASTARPEHCAG